MKELIAEFSSLIIILCIVVAVSALISASIASLVMGAIYFAFGWWDWEMFRSIFLLVVCVCLYAIMSAR